MKIKSLLIAAIVALGGSMAVNAQNPEILSNESALAEGVCGPQNCGPKDGLCGPKDCCSPRECAAFEGITLTEAQKTALKQLKADRKNKALEAKKAKRQADSLKRVARRAERLEYLHQVQKILTPDQYVTFLENTIVNNGGPGKGFKPGKEFMGGPRHGKQFNRDNNGPCPYNKEGKPAKDTKDKKNKRNK